MKPTGLNCSTQSPINDMLSRAGKAPPKGPKRPTDPGNRFRGSFVVSRMGWVGCPRVAGVTWGRVRAPFSRAFLAFPPFLRPAPCARRLFCIYKAASLPIKFWTITNLLVRIRRWGDSRRSQKSHAREGKSVENGVGWVVSTAVQGLITQIYFLQKEELNCKM